NTKPGANNNASIVPVAPVPPSDELSFDPADPEPAKPKPTPKPLVKNPLKLPDDDLPPAQVVEINVPAPKAVLSLEAQKINRAIDKGIAYLKGSQHPSG